MLPQAFNSAIVLGEIVRQEAFDWAVSAFEFIPRRFYGGK
jgi:hypothetical protein